MVRIEGRSTVAYKPMKNVMKFYSECKTLILNYCKSPVTKAVCEGINSICSFEDVY
jgi:hypothetical protein